MIYLVGETTNNVPNSVYLESTVAHEVGHQWFYGVLGDDQVNQPWLDESLTQYITGMYYTERYSDQAAEGFKDSWYSRWDQVDQQKIPIGMPVKNYDPKTYGAIIYGRGPIFLTALHDEMGAGVFGQFLKDYYTQNMWENVTGEIFIKTAEATCSCDLNNIFDQWVVSK
jgi:aminopeptidase N